MRTKSKAGLAILAGGPSFVGAATATDLIVNGGFETVTGGTPQCGGVTDGTETGWKGVVSSLPYSGAYYAGPAVPFSENRGAFYSWRFGQTAGCKSPGPALPSYNPPPSQPGRTIR